MKKKEMKEFKLVLLGVSGVGKTSLIQRFTQNIFNSAQTATYGLSYLKHTINVENTAIKLNSNWIWKFSIQYFISIALYRTVGFLLCSFFSLFMPQSLGYGGSRKVRRVRSNDHQIIFLHHFIIFFIELLWMSI